MAEHYSLNSFGSSLAKVKAVDAVLASCGAPLRKALTLSTSVFQLLMAVATWSALGWFVHGGPWRPARERLGAADAADSARARVMMHFILMMGTMLTSGDGAVREKKTGSKFKMLRIDLVDGLASEEHFQQIRRGLYMSPFKRLVRYPHRRCQRR